jgi:hypothetical protein
MTTTHPIALSAADEVGISHMRICFRMKDCALGFAPRFKRATAPSVS